jgi:hypothetical protein
VTLTAAFRRPFAFQVAAFRLRLQQLQPTMKWTDVWQEGHDRAFMVAGVMKADILSDLAAAVDKAISQGTSLEEFRRDFRKIVAEKGWIGGAGQGTKGGEAWRTRVIYRTNMASTYAAGRWAQLQAAGYPFIIYHHGNSLEPRVQHLAWDGLVLEADHPFWATHAPPNGWGCSCYVSGARTMDQARRLGGKPGKELPDGWQARDPRTGAPKGIDRGWAYAPGASVAETVAQIAEKLPKLPAPIARDLAGSIPGLADRVPVPEVIDPGPLDWRSWPKASSLPAVAAAAKAAGVAENITLRASLPLRGVDAYLRAGAEITQRFGLAPLTHFSEAADLPFRTRVDRGAAAFYVPSKRAMAVKIKGVTPAQIKRLFDTDQHPSAIAKWQVALERASAEVKTRAAQVRNWRWSVIKDVPGVAAHEWGHHLHYSFRSEIDALIDANRMIEDRWPLLVSNYGGRNREEFIAESFALYMSGDETQFFRLHPALLNWLRRKEGKL